MAKTRTLLYSLLLLLLLVSLPRSEPYTPDGDSWRLLYSSIGISAMHMQLLPGDQVLMFDRTDFGPSNLSLPFGRCRLDSNELALKTDCTAHSLLLQLPSSSLRPLTLLTDTWCSSASLLPNGSILQSGGFNDGDRVVRLLSPLQNSSDWVELSDYLVVRRWYSSNQLLPDGRVIILGGRHQFNYEFFPKQEPNPLFPFPFLDDTRDSDAENNLYPFLHLLPDGTLFVFANTQSVILDVSDNRVLRRLPPIHGGEPRSYPSSGSSVLLPLHPNASVPTATRAEILICGGAPRGSFQRALNGSFKTASRTCGRIAVTDPDPEWEMEEMPMPRVMGDMLLLPTGDVIIINGAASGTAGWELARDPVTNPVLYRPSKLPGQRFRVLGGSTIPRLYHSSAVVDTYGRVLVGGSNPHVYYNFTNVLYPTELSLEAFHPPYMDERYGPVRPRIVEWATRLVGYGEGVGVRFVVEEYQPSMGVSVVVIAPAFKTHAVGMNQRLVVVGSGSATHVEAFTYEAEAVMPPTAEIAPPGYYVMFVVHVGVPSQGVWVQIQ